MRSMYSIHQDIPAVSIPLYPVVVPVDREIISQEQVITKEFDSSTGERRVLILMEGEAFDFVIARWIS